MNDNSSHNNIKTHTHTHTHTHQSKFREVTDAKSKIDGKRKKTKQVNKRMSACVCALVTATGNNVRD